MSGLEIVLFFVGLALVLGPFGATLLLVFVLPKVLYETTRVRRFPVQVPGFKARLSQPPPFKANLEDVARVFRLMLEHSVTVKGYGRKAAKKKLDGLNVEWLPGVVENGTGHRYIVDDWGRKIAGDHRGDLIRVVYLPEDKVRNVALAHEIGHELHELEGLTDYDHEDKEMWGTVVGRVKDLI